MQFRYWGANNCGYKCTWLISIFVSPNGTKNLYLFCMFIYCCHHGIERTRILWCAQVCSAVCAHMYTVVRIRVGVSTSRTYTGVLRVYTMRDSRTFTYVQRMYTVCTSRTYTGVQRTSRTYTGVQSMYTVLTSRTYAGVQSMYTVLTIRTYTGVQSMYTVRTSRTYTGLQRTSRSYTVCSACTHIYVLAAPIYTGMQCMSAVYALGARAQVFALAARIQVCVYLQHIHMRQAH